MKKIIVICPHCKNKMRILNKVAKYKCPSCQEIYKFNHFRKFNSTIVGLGSGFIQTLKDIKFNIITRYRNAKATYNYMKQMKQNMKNNPNWSNYHREKAEEKRMQEALKPNFWDKFKRKKG